MTDEGKTHAATTLNQAQPEAESKPTSPISPSSTQPVESPLEKPTEPTAEDIKEQGNIAFKAKKYDDAIDLYTKAIEMRPTEPSYLTNRAASYMALKRFRLALADCQQATTLQSAEPSAKTLIRLARCHLALGSSEPALMTLSTAISLEPNNAAALQLQDKVLELEAKLCSLDGAKRKKEWEVARLTLDKCLQSIEGEGSEVPTQWRLWRVELELARADWDAADIAANDAMRHDPKSPEVLAVRGLVFFLSGKLPQALQQVASALRLDPEHEVASRLRKRIKDIERIKEEGNAAFKSGRLLDAVKLYTDCLKCIGVAEEEGKGGHIRATLLSNRATTLVKLKAYDSALVDTKASLALIPTSFKALRTRARIHFHLEEFDAAVAGFKVSIEHAKSEGAGADARSLGVELKKAEAALKQSQTKDYYKILGLPRDCSRADIQKAYRQMSRYPPAVEAYTVLSDRRRRERYDMGEDEDGRNNPGMPRMGGPPGGRNPADLSDIFAPFHGGGGLFGGGRAFGF